MYGETLDLCPYYISTEQLTIKIFCKVTIYTHIHIRTKNENVRRPCADNHISTVYGFYLQLTSLIDLKHCLKKHPFKESIFQADLLMP